MRDIAQVMLIGPAKVDFAGYVQWTLVVMASIILLGIVLLVFRRMMVAHDDAVGQQAGFSIGALEAMRERGEIGPEEFKVLRRAALGLDGGGENEDNAPSSGGGGMSMNDEV